MVGKEAECPSTVGGKTESKKACENLNRLVCAYPPECPQFGELVCQKDHSGE